MERFSAIAVAVCLGASGLMAQNARVRVLHASPDAPNVDVYVDGTRVLEDLPFREHSEYLALPPGAHSIEVRPTGTSTTVLQAAPTLAANTDYTAIALGRVASIELMLLTDDNTAPADGQIRLRAIHGAPGAPAVDVYLTTPFETLMGKTAALTSVPFKAVSPQPPARATWRSTAAGSPPGAA
jgi:hypothetical protein